MKSKVILILAIISFLFLSSCTKLDLPWMQPGGGVDNQPASIVCTGNRISSGPGLDSADKYPAQMARLLVKQGFVNLTVIEKGETFPAHIQGMAHQLNETVDPYKITNGKNIVLVTEFTDDSWENHQTAGSSIRFMKDYCDSLHAHGWQVYTSTTPYQNPYYERYAAPFPGSDALVTPSAYDSAEYIAQLSAINDSLRQHWSEFSDGIVDAQADARFQHYDPLYYMPDHVNLTKQGAAAFAELAAAAVTTSLKN